MLHRTGHLFIRHHTAVINSIRSRLAEFGIVAPVGRKGLTELLQIVADPSDKRVLISPPASLRSALSTALLWPFSSFSEGPQPAGRLSAQTRVATPARTHGSISRGFGGRDFELEQFRRSDFK